MQPSQIFIFNFPFSTVNLPQAAFGNSLRALLAFSIFSIIKRSRVGKLACQRASADCSASAPKTEQSTKCRRRAAKLAGSIKIPYPSVGLPLTSVVNKGQQNYYFSFSYFNWIFFAYSRGAEPIFFLKAQLKQDCDENPHSQAISVSVISVDMSRLIDFLIR